MCHDNLRQAIVHIVDLSTGALNPVQAHRSSLRCVLATSSRQR